MLCIIAGLNSKTLLQTFVKIERLNTEDVTATPKLSLSHPFFVTFQIEVRWRDNNFCITKSHNSRLTTRWLPKMLVFDEVTRPGGLVEIKLAVWIHFLCSPLDISGHLCAHINQGLPTKKH